MIASRLADADPSLSVLIIEGGPDGRNLPTITHPALYPGNFRPGSDTFRFYHPSVEEQLSNRAALVIAGSVLGGGSCINGAIHIRAQEIDFDSWGAEGCSAENLKPFLRKVR